MTRRTRLLVLGGSGMLGHKLWERARVRLDAYATVRDRAVFARCPELDDAERVIPGVDVEHFDTVEAAIDRVSPTVIVNAVGLVKQRRQAADPVAAIRVNALLPHLLHESAARRGIRFIHISTDCVFDGVSGGYRESDAPNARDLYGRSKALGEVEGPAALTLRTSIIGRELRGQAGLVEWFLSRHGATVDGYTQARFSGLTTLVFADLLIDVIERHAGLTGIYHVSGDPIDKARLLQLINDAFRAGVEIVPSSGVRIDRRLDGSAFRERTGFDPPPWEAMIAGLVADASPYDKWRP